MYQSTTFLFLEFKSSTKQFFRSYRQRFLNPFFTKSKQKKIRKDFSFKIDFKYLDLLGNFFPKKLLLRSRLKKKRFFKNIANDETSKSNYSSYRR